MRPEESGESIRPGTAKTSRPHSFARRAVMSDPLRTRPRSRRCPGSCRRGCDCGRGSAPGAARCPIGRSLSSVPPRPHARRARCARAGRPRRCPSRAPRAYSRAPRARLSCAAPSMPRASPLTTTTPACVRPSASSRATARPYGVAPSRADDRDGRSALESGRPLGDQMQAARRAARGGAADTRDRRDRSTRAPAAVTRSSSRSRGRARSPTFRAARPRRRDSRPRRQTSRARPSAPHPTPEALAEPPSEDVADPRRRPQRNPPSRVIHPHHAAGIVSDEFSDRKDAK